MIKLTIDKKQIRKARRFIQTELQKRNTIEIEVPEDLVDKLKEHLLESSEEDEIFEDALENLN